MNRKAFIVGINDYAPIGPGAGPERSGPVNDARDFTRTINVLGVARHVQDPCKYVPTSMLQNRGYFQDSSG
jgi:hypothetical protein